MADAANKQPENAGGKYYVDDQCIDCDLCRETAPENFKRQEDGGYSFVYKQPENEEQDDGGIGSLQSRTLQCAGTEETEQEEQKDQERTS